MMRVVVSGAGVAGTSAAMHLAKAGCEVVVVDPRPPLTATSQYSSECYRNFFMDPAAVPLMERSIEIMEALHAEHNIAMNRKGYVFLTGTEEGGRALMNMAEHASRYGAGDVRLHCNASTYTKSPEKGLTDDKGNTFEGFDVMCDNDEIRKVMPFASTEATCMVHARKAGWLDAQGLGSVYLREGRKHGVRTVLGEITEIDTTGGPVRRVCVRDEKTAAEQWVECDAFVNAAGAWAQHVNGMLGAPALDLKTEIVSKVILNDVRQVIPQREAPFVVWRDPVTIPWGDEMREALFELDDTAEGGTNNCSEWVKEQPGGQHIRPLGNNRVLLMWEHVHRHVGVDGNPEFPVSKVNDFYPQIALKGAQFIAPGLRVYEDTLGKDTTIDAGYYVTTPDGRPIVSPHGPDNAFALVGLSGWGIMSSAACGELLAQIVANRSLPSYYASFSLPRIAPLEGPVISLLDPPVGEQELEAFQTPKVNLTAL